jgi:uncharacterized cupredoxin-like copper-binding protein
MPRLRISLPFVFAVFVVAALPAALQARSSSSSETISVTVGVPHELSFHLSPSRITAPTAVFKVMNKGKLHHSFKICTRPSTTDKANSCTGVATKALAPGATAEVTVKLSASGTYEYLSGAPSQAASGMKGLLTVTLASTTPSGSAGSGTTATTTPATTTTTPSSSGGAGGNGGVVNGQATDPACAPGTLIAVGPSAGDEDDDNEGGFPSDGDGCL